MIHKKMDVWKLSVELVVDIYKLTRGFPPEERFGLMHQIRRAAVSVPSNIAEGAARKSSLEFVQFLHVALGSLAELETQLIISERLGFCHEDITLILKDQKRIGQMLIGLIRHLKAK